MKIFKHVLVLIICLFLVACEHTHKFGDWVVVKEATEEEEGIKLHICYCGEQETDTIEKLAHTHKFGGWVVVKEATEEEGLKERTCKCGEKETEVLPKLEHTHKFGDWVVVKETTEEEEGSKERTCKCGEKETEAIEKLAHTHKFGGWVVVKEATEEEEGIKLHICYCGEQETDTIEKLAHTHKFGGWVLVKEATIYEEGIIERTCLCGEKETEAIEKIVHTHEFGDWVVVKEATEEEEGIKERTCACGEKESEEIEKLDHTHKFGDWIVVKVATEEEIGLKERACTCGEKETEAIEKLDHTHKFGDWIVVKVATEEEEGSKERTCSCGEKETEVLPKLEHTHKFGEWVVVKEATIFEEGLKERTCACGEKETEVIEPVVDTDITLSDPAVAEIARGTEYTFNGMKFFVGYTAFPTLKQAVEVATNTVYVAAGKYEENITIAKNNITLVGPNQDINAQYENRNNEAVIANKVTIAEGVQNVTINGFELTGSGQILPLADTNNVSVKYCVINKTSADGVVRGPAEGNINNLEFSYNYAEGNTSYRIIYITMGLNGFTAINNYITNAVAYDFLNVGTTATSFLGGDVLIKDNTYIKSNQSFLYVGGVKAINAVIEGNYLENIANTGIDFRTMNDEEAAVATFDIKNNTFNNAGCGWRPIRIRTAGYTEGDSIAIYVENNKFIESAYNEGGKPQFLENPSFGSQTDPFKTIYVIGKNYYEWKGEPFTEISGFNFCDAQISFEEAYASEDDMPEYVVENQVKPTGVQITNKVETMEAFTTHQIAVKLSPEDVTNKKVSYVTSDSNVATVSTAGLITPKSEGTCTITV